ncbi:MAG: hypothetical protein OXB88_11535 [Bacteriovoracales bacterium]|nr:hypothetical protein [Bacteriovoracales bacterium]
MPELAYSGREVDCIIGNRMAVEIKSTEQAQHKHLKGLKALKQEMGDTIEKYILVSRDTVQKDVDGITMIYWQDFIRELWERF